MLKQGVVTMAKRIICGDRALACESEITVDPKLWFEPGTGVPCKRRQGDVGPGMAVLHWTGAENPVETFYKNCLKRKVSAHFFIADDGTIHQLADVWDTICYHAKSVDGVVNKRAIGIEIQNKGLVPEGRIRRAVYVDTINGKKLKMLMFNTVQVDAVLALLEAFADAELIKREVPRGPDTDAVFVGGSGPDQYGALLRTPMTTKALATFRGVCAHYHVPGSGKYDAGTQLFYALLDEGWSF
jgi:hypothetical protein